MKLTGKYSGENDSSFVDFEVDELLSAEQFDKIEEERSCYEAIWQGKDNKFDSGFTLLISFDDCEDSDIDLLEEVLDDESMKIIKEMHEDSQRVRF